MHRMGTFSDCITCETASLQHAAPQGWKVLADSKDLVGWVELQAQNELRCPGSSRTPSGDSPARAIGSRASVKKWMVTPPRNPHRHGHAPEEFHGSLTAKTFQSRHERRKAQQPGSATVSLENSVQASPGVTSSRNTGKHLRRGVDEKQHGPPQRRRP